MTLNCAWQVGRLSYAFGLTGPCVSTDTACSSSLVAAHLATKALVHGEVGASVVGGINAMLLPETTAGISQLQALSAVGRCRCARAGTKEGAQGGGNPS